MADRSITLLELNLPEQMTVSAGEREFSLGGGSESETSTRATGTASEGSGRKLLAAALVVAAVAIGARLLQSRGLEAAEELDELGVRQKITR